MIFLFIFLFFIIFLIGEFTLKISLIPREFSRKFSHVFSGLLVLALPRFISVPEIIFIGGLFTVLMVIFERLKLFKAITNTERKSLGSILFPLGLTLAALMFLERSQPAFEVAVLLVTVSDTLACFVGMKFGKRRILKKTLSGAASFFVSSLTIYFAFGKSLPSAALFAFLLSILESSLLNGLDNLFIPIVGGLLFL